MIKLWLLNHKEEIKEMVELIRAIHSQSVNGANTLVFECTNHVEKLDHVIYQDEQSKWHEFIVQGITENKESISVYAEHASYELHSFYVKDRKPTETPTSHLQTLLEGTRWSVGTVEKGAPVFVSYYYLTIYDAIAKLVENCKGELSYRITVNGNKITGRYVDILNRVGVDVGKRFTYRKDLKNVTRTILDDEIYTALVGRGRGEEIGDGYGRRITFADLSKPDSPVGIEYVFDSNALSQWGIEHNGQLLHRIGIVEFDDIEDKEELYTATKELLEKYSSPQVNYKVEVALLNDEHENVAIGDSVFVFDKDFRGKELRFNGRIIRFDKNLVHSGESVVTIGQLIGNLATHQAQIDHFINQFRSKSKIWDRSNAFDSNNSLEASYIKNLLQEWNDRANSSGGYTYAVEGQGQITYDRPIDQEPTQALQIVGGTMRIANSKLPNGDWDWRTVMTADGIAGQEILAQSITANQLRSDVGASLDLSSNESIQLTVKESIDDVEDKISEINVDLSSIRLEVSQIGGYNIISNPIGRFDTLDWTFESSHIKAYANAPYNKAYTIAPYLKAQADNGSIMVGVETDTQAKYGFRVWKSGKALSQYAIAESGSDYSLHTKVKGDAVLRFKLREYTSATPTSKSSFFKETLLGTTNPTTNYSTYEKTVTLDNTTQSVVLVVESDVSSRNGQFALFTNTSFNIGQPKPYGESITDVNNRVDDINARVTLSEDKVNIFTSRVSTVEGRVDSNTAELQVQAGEISSKVSTNGVVSAINQTAESIKINASRIDLTGVDARLTVAEDAVDLVASRVDTVEGKAIANTAQLTVQAGEISSKVSTDGIVSAINQTSETIKIDASKINLTGYVTFSNLTTEINSTKSYADTKANTAQSNAKTYTDAQMVAIDGVLKTYTDSEISAFSGGLGDLSFKDKIGIALLDNTIIDGGYIRTNLISFNNAVGTNVNLTGTITATDGKIGGFDISSGNLVGTSVSLKPNEITIGDSSLQSESTLGHVLLKGVGLAIGTGKNDGFNSWISLQRNSVQYSVATFGTNGILVNADRLQPVTLGTNSLIGHSSGRYGSIYLVNQPNVSSDSRYKFNIDDIDPLLIEIFGTEVKPKSYNTVYDDKQHFGYVAQDVEKALYKYLFIKYCEKTDKLNASRLANQDVSKFSLLSKDESYMSLLYGEVNVIIEAYHRLQNEKLEERIAVLEKGE